MGIFGRWFGVLGCCVGVLGVVHFDVDGVFGIWLGIFFL